MLKNYLILLGLFYVLFSTCLHVMFISSTAQVKQMCMSWLQPQPNYSSPLRCYVLVNQKRARSLLSSLAYRYFVRHVGLNNTAMSLKRLQCFNRRPPPSPEKKEKDRSQKERLCFNEKVLIHLKIKLFFFLNFDFIFVYCFIA